MKGYPVWGTLFMLYTDVYNNKVEYLSSTSFSTFFMLYGIF